MPEEFVTQLPDEEQYQGWAAFNQTIVFGDVKVERYAIPEEERSLLPKTVDTTPREEGQKLNALVEDFRFENPDKDVIQRIIHSTWNFFMGLYSKYREYNQAFADELREYISSYKIPLNEDLQHSLEVIENVKREEGNS